MKTCPHCGTRKSLGEFTRDKNTRDGLSVYCRPCKSKTYKAWYEANKAPLKRPFGADQKLLAHERFAKRYAVDDAGCWNWLGATAAGYGVIATERGRQENAHRFSYRAHVGPIPDGAYVCHRCDNKLCVRPDHLFVGTAKDNMRDAVSKGRQARGAQHSERIKSGIAARR